MSQLTEDMNETFPLNLPPNADYETYSAVYRESRMLRFVAVVLGLGFALASAAAYQFSHRKPIVLITRVNQVGEAQAIKYTSTEFTPDDGVVRHSLYNWAKLRYTLNKDTAAHDYADNWYFLSENLSSAGMSSDNASLRIAKIIAGQGAPNELEIRGVQIQNLSTRKDANGRIAEGRAVVSITKIFPAMAGQETRNEHWTVSVDFYINPQEGAERYAKDPKYQLVNPLGFTITFLHEDRAE